MYKVDVRMHNKFFNFILFLLHLNSRDKKAIQFDNKVHF